MTKSKAVKKSAPKKTKTNTKQKTKSVKTANRAGLRGGSVGGEPRECSVCHKLGHNRRSHEPGGKLFRK